ncbi:MAG: sulfatase-like hydrolase/transferase [Pedosphaera sp.]|nr:sulfatase-like hydrolase/transferase [Pedosphaera sp.]
MHRLFCLLMAFVWSAVLSAKDSKDSRPNFVVILCDDLGYGDLACYGHPHIKTPHLDKLATQGMRLTSCYAAAPVCSPSRAGMLTGRTPNRSGVYNWIPGNHVMHLRKDEVTVAGILKASGYDTAHVGKWHCNGKFNSPAQPQPGDHGFNHWFATQNNAAPSHKNPRNFVRNGKSVGPMEGYACQLVVDEGVDWLRNGRDKQKPFFLFTCFHEPHEPVASPGKMTAGYSEVARNKLEAEYFANVENMDAAVGKLMAALDELKLADNTLVFFTSDNGPETLRRYGGAARSFGSP